MGRSGSTASQRARQMRRVLARWQRSRLTLREFGEQREIPLSTLTWWRQVFRRAGEQLNVASKGVQAGDTAVFTEVPRVARAPIVQPVLEIVLHSGHVVRVPAGADTTRCSA
ncbi:MAG: IS66 family insertion sequence element accessory protein TnpA [Candidatus Binataceae bacterium]